MELRHLRSFVAVAQELHFTRAAERLHMAQQALSVQIRQLEAELGVTLLHRTTRTVELTAAGETLMERSVRILDAVDEAASAARRTAAGEEGDLRIAYTYTLGITTLPAIVEHVREIAPQLNLGTVQVLTDQAILGLVHGQFDLAFVRAPQLPEDVKAITVRREPLGVILGEAHTAAAQSVVHPEDLDDSSIVVWPRGYSPGYSDRIMEQFPRHRDRGLVRVYKNFSNDGFIRDPGSRDEIAAGRAFQLAFEGHYDPVPEGFVWRPLQPQITIDVALIYRAGRLTAAQKRVIQLAKEVSVARGWNGSITAR